MYVYTNVLGTHFINEKFEIVETHRFQSEKEKIESMHSLLKEGFCEKEKHWMTNKPELKKPNTKELSKILVLFKNDAKEFYEENLKLTRKLIKESVKRDHLIIQAVNSIEDLDKNINQLSKRMREWYALYFPEAEKMIPDNEAIAKVMVTKNKEELEKELNIKNGMGSDLRDSDVKIIIEFAKQINNLFLLRQEQLDYIEKVMEQETPNIKAVAGASIGAKLLASAGGLHKLAMIPASTIQLLGAETALFRHLRTGAKPPKHGLIINHPLLSKAKKDQRGKVARVLADKIAIAAKIDYFKGEFIGEKLREELEKKFG